MSKLKGKIEKKFYLSAEDIQKLNECCVHFHKNLSEMISRSIQISYREMKKDQHEEQEKENMDLFEVLKATTEQLAKIEKEVNELRSKCDRRVSKAEFEQRLSAIENKGFLDRLKGK